MTAVATDPCIRTQPRNPIAFAPRADYSARVSSVGSVPGLEPRAPDALLAEPARYVLDSHLAQGGMAALYRGQRLAPGGFSKPVVLKRLRPELSESTEAAALFLREACLSASLEHPAIVRVLDLTEIDGICFLVMELVRGGDLRLVLRRTRRRGRRLSPAAALFLGRELCSALDYAHGLCRPDGRPLGLIHRDVSPTNIMLSVEGEIKLTDFGIAQADAELGTGPHARGQVGYMSPEQARGEALDARSDLFSLAAVLYEVFTDRRLFVGQVGQSPAEIYGAKIAPPSKLCAGLSPELDAVLLRALSLAPDERPATARELYEQLHAATCRANLWMDRASFATHLREICGADPAEWSTLEERTATALIASIELDAMESSDGLDGLLGPSGGLARRAGELAPRDEPSEHAITMPFPTLPASQPVPSEGDDTMPLPSRVLSQTVEQVPDPVPTPPVVAVSDDAALVAAKALPALALDEDEPEATEQTAPKEKLSDRVTTQELDRLHQAQLLSRRRRGSGLAGWFSRDRLFGLALGLLLSVLVWMILSSL